MKKLVVLFLLLSCFLCFSAMADTEETTVLETMIVTGSGQKATLLDTNASIHVITAKDIKNSGQSKTVDIITSIPGVVNQKFGSKTYISIRGTRTSMSGGPKIYVDGRPINVGVYGYSKIDSIPVDNIEKIEVIKSPSTAKYGESAGRGVILITTKKGADSESTFGGMVSGEYGSWDSMKLNATVNGKKDQLDYSISAYANQAEGYRSDDRDVQSVDGQMGWIFEGGRIDWLAGFNQAFNKYPAGLTLEQLWIDRTVSAYGTLTPNETDEDLVNTKLNLQYDRNDWLLNASAGFSRDHQDYKRLEDVQTDPDDYYNDDRVDYKYDFAITAGRRFNTDSVSQLASVGLDYAYNEFEQDRVYPLDPSKNTGTTAKKANIDAERNFFGANLNHEISWEILQLETGVRYNYVTYDLSNQVPATLERDFENDIDWSISPSMSLWDNTNLFVTWNHSHFYLPLGFYKTNMEKDFDGILEPEIYDTVELGWKHQVNKAINYSVILYWTQVDDKVGSFYDGSTFKGRANIGTSIHKGIEAEIDGRPWDWLGYRASFTTIDAEWDEGTYGSSAINLAGKKVNYVPDYEYLAGIDFYPIRNSSIGSITISVDVRGFGQQYEDVENTLERPAANFVDAKITWAYQGFECYLTSSNLLDAEWERASNANGKEHSDTTFDGLYPIDGRFIGVGVAYHF